MEKKVGISVEELCQGLPGEFATDMKHVRALQYGRRPDYNMLRYSFRSLARKEHVEYDDVFHWTTRLYAENTGRML